MKDVGVAGSVISSMDVFWRIGDSVHIAVGARLKLPRCAR